MRLVLFTALLIVTSSVTLTAQSEDSSEAGWPIIEQCVTFAEEPLTTYSGRIFTYEPEVGVRGVRADLPSSYFVAFDGANFTGAATLSPSGDFIAIPSGLVSFATLVDETYQVNEIRVQSTDPATTSIANRIPWTANYRGTERDQIMRDIQWVDDGTLLYGIDSWESEFDETELFFINASTDEATQWNNRIGSQIAEGLSPDRTRAFGLVDYSIGLYDVETGDQLIDATHPRTKLHQWAPDSGQLIIQSSQRVDGESLPKLMLMSREGEIISTVGLVEAHQVRWSADSNRFAFSVYDEETRGHRLIIADITDQTLTDTCINVRYGNNTTGYGLIWSADGTYLAILRDDTFQPLHILDINTRSVALVENYNDTFYSFLIHWAG